MNVSAIEFECDAPWSIHMNGVPGWFETVQGMEIVSRHLQFIQAGRIIQNIEPDENALLHLGVYLRSLSRLEQIRQRFVLE
jgi:hypothetical protein